MTRTSADIDHVVWAFTGDDERIDLVDVLTLDEPVALRCCYAMARDYRDAYHAGLARLHDERRERDREHEQRIALIDENRQLREQLRAREPRPA